MPKEIQKMALAILIFSEGFACNVLPRSASMFYIHVLVVAKFIFESFATNVAPIFHFVTSLVMLN